MLSKASVAGGWAGTCVSGRLLRCHEFTSLPFPSSSDSLPFFLARETFGGTPEEGLFSSCRRRPTGISRLTHASVTSHVFTATAVTGRSEL